MWLSLQRKQPVDFVLATGKTHTVRQFINEAIKYYGFKAYWTGKNDKEKLILKGSKKVIIKINKKFYRPNEVNKLLGDPKMTKRYLNWKPKVNFKELVKLMCEATLKDIKTK